jgi:kynurenine formamidase
VIAATLVVACLTAAAAAAAKPGTWLDLTHPFDAATIYWPTEKGFEFDPGANGPTAKGYYYAANRFTTAEHGGTHLDAPRHFSATGQTSDAIPVERLVGDAHLMDRTVLAAIDNADVPGCFTHLFVLREGRLETAGPADPGAFAAGRTWTYAIVCRGAAEAAARVLEQRGGGVRAVDADTVTIMVDSERSGPADAVAAVVRAGIAVERAGYQPPWPAQLIR